MKTREAGDVFRRILEEAISPLNAVKRIVGTDAERRRCVDVGKMDDPVHLRRLIAELVDVMRELRDFAVIDRYEDRSRPAFDAATEVLKKYERRRLDASGSDVTYLSGLWSDSDTFVVEEFEVPE